MWVFQKIAHQLGFSARKVGATLLALGFMKTLYSARAPRRSFPSNDEFPSYPIFGQVGLIVEGLQKGMAYVQLTRARRRGFTSDEVVMFGNLRDTAIMDPRDREHMLKTNWKNYVKNANDGTGFQENFAEVMGRGIFAVVRVEALRFFGLAITNNNKTFYD